MVAIEDFESTRLELQAKLDSGKTSVERNKLGQFATPTALALDILMCARALFPSDRSVRFLDPAIGTGSFYSALLRTFAPAMIASASGYEIDPHYGDKARELWKGTHLHVHLTDFTRAIPPESNNHRANLLICNPPYVRHHHIPSNEKMRLHNLVKTVAGVELSGLAGLYCYFLCLSHLWMATDGLAGWLIPSEFLDVNYGQQVKNYLLNRVTLLRVHRFDPNDVQFGDALVSSAVVWFNKSVPPATHSVEFSYGGALNQPRLSRTVLVDVLKRTAKWSSLPLVQHGIENQTTQLRLRDLFTIQRGLATGANKFFVLTPEQVAMYSIPTEFVKPILPSPRYITGDEIQADEKGSPLVEQKLYLLSCNRSEEDVKVNYPTLWKYLQSGVVAGIDKQYLCAHRTPWYSQEDRPPPLFVCTYIGRSDTARGTPFRFILNWSKATVANAYLVLYPKPVLQRFLKSNPDAIIAVWKALKRITPETLIGEGRVYGGGLHKMEPKELGNTPANLIIAAIPELQSERLVQQRLFNT